MYEAHFSNSQKAVILSSILREHHEHGHDLRECCRAQGIKLQTFNKWRWQARTQADMERLALHNADGHEEHPDEPNGNVALAEPEAPPEVDGNRADYVPPKPRREAPKTAMQLALERARITTYAHDPAHDPEDEEPEPEPEPGPVLTTPTPTPEPSPEAPMSTLTTPTGKERMAATLAARFPWLAKVEERTTAKMGYPKPEPKESGKYHAWTQCRAELMTDKQREAWAQVFARARPNFKANEQAELAKARAEAPPKEPKPKLGRPPKLAKPAKVNGHAVEVGPSVAELEAQRARLNGEIAHHPATEAFVALRERTDRAHESEVDRLRRAVAVLTLENLQLRGLL